MFSLLITLTVAPSLVQLNKKKFSENFRYKFSGAHNAVTRIKANIPKGTLCNFANGNFTVTRSIYQRAQAMIKLLPIKFAGIEAVNLNSLLYST